MGILDRWRKGAKAASAPREAPAAGEQAVVPEGHRVFTYGTSALPRIDNSQAVVWLAHLGISSDAAEDELDEILGSVDALTQGSRPRILLSSEPGPLSSLMAPNDPKVTVEPHGVLLWTLDAEGLAGAPRGAWLVQRWLRCLHALGRQAMPPRQCVYLHEIESPRARTLSALVRGLGIEVRMPEAHKGLVLVEVARPENVVLTALAGSTPAATPADRFALEANQAKDATVQAGDRGRLQQLEAEERAQLERKLASASGEPQVPPVRRAPRLRRLLLAAADSAAARPALYQELLQREVPLQVMVDPKTKEGSLQRWPGGVDAIAVYADAGSLLASARERGLQPGSFAGAIMPPRKLLAWAAEHGWTLAFNTFREGQAIYVLVAADEVKALARGELPAAMAAQS